MDQQTSWEMQVLPDSNSKWTRVLLVAVAGGSLSVTRTPVRNAGNVTLHYTLYSSADDGGIKGIR